ncbi:M48 family metalloprotease [Pseudanabaena sp. FACHB-1998]|uniref:M48 family metalloprotease n=1 Tax=Pseudanabaena sp. FACHB-1998 TaxID=2692858 RepID=UPI00168146FB|nr:M48 family metalloprotease [Pseudanabaena sp. FACHB-1998]MBD2178551.1 M48 family metalloprotease [Pseudanabaena sp. FACHB-1998]
MSLKAGKEALLRKHYTEAIAILSEYSQDSSSTKSKDYVQAQIWLVSAYKKTGRADKAIAICEKLAAYTDPQIQTWAQKSLITLNAMLDAPPDDRIQRNQEVASVVKSDPRRYRKNNVTLSLPSRYTYFLIAALILTTLTIPALQFLLGYGISRFFTDYFTDTWFKTVAIAASVISILLFFMSPWIIDITQKQYHRIQWITLADLDLRSPESVEIIEEFCERQNIFVPRLGWIEDDAPVAFIYGVISNSARIVVSRGLFDCLDDDELAAVYAYQLGRIRNKSFAVLTFISAPVQVLYYIYVLLSRRSYQAKSAKQFWQVAATFANVIYSVSNYLLIWLSHASTIVSDRFAAEVTGNPNALARALPKMARQMLPYNQPAMPTNRLLESTRALGICDRQTMTAIGLAMEIAHAGQTDQNPYRVFLWEMFNPWRRWLEIHSTHPLVGKRLQLLAGYSKQLGLLTEYDFAELLKEEKKLNKKVLYQNFWRDLLIQISPLLGVAIALIAASFLTQLYNRWLWLSLSLIGLGLGFMYQGSLRYPDFRKVADTDLVSLLTDPYASYVQGKPVQIAGELLGYSTDEFYIGYALRLEDQGGLAFLNYIPNFQQWVVDPSNSIKNLEVLRDRSVIASGWFRRGKFPIVDLSTLQPIMEDQPKKRASLISYHQFWNNIGSSILVLVGLASLILTSRIL